MTNKEAVEMMKAKLECMTREVSGTDRDCNAKKCDECDLCYEQGNMGEQKEWLRMGIEALENQNTGCWILDETDNSITCNKCGCLIWANDISNGEAHYCPNCGANMKGENK